MIRTVKLTMILIYGRHRYYYFEITHVTLKGSIAETSLRLSLVFDCNNIHRCSMRSGTISSVTRQYIRYTQSETSVLKKRRRVRFENGTNERKEICVSDFCKIRPRYERSVRCAFALYLNRFPCFPACSENRRSFMRIISGRPMHRRCTEDIETRNTCTFCVSSLSPF